jgi:hypothetical protein
MNSEAALKWPSLHVIGSSIRPHADGNDEIIHRFRERSPYPAKEVRRKKDARDDDSGCYLAIAGSARNRGVLRSLFATGNAGSRRSSRDPGCLAHPALRHRLLNIQLDGPEAPKNALIAGVGWGRISANGGCKHSRAKWIPGVYVRHLQPIRRCVRLQGLTEWHGSCPHPARS